MTDVPRTAWALRSNEQDDSDSWLLWTGPAGAFRMLEPYATLGHPLVCVEIDEVEDVNEDTGECWAEVGRIVRRVPDAALSALADRHLERFAAEYVRMNEAVRAAPHWGRDHDPRGDEAAILAHRTWLAHLPLFFYASPAVLEPALVRMAEAAFALCDFPEGDERARDLVLATPGVRARWAAGSLSDGELDEHGSSLEHATAHWAFGVPSHFERAGHLALALCARDRGDQAAMFARGESELEYAFGRSGVEEPPPLASLDRALVEALARESSPRSPSQPTRRPTPRSRRRPAAPRGRRRRSRFLRCERPCARGRARHDRLRDGGRRAPGTV